MKTFAKIAMMSVVAVVLMGCDRATSNVHVISTSDCGANWEKINTGNAVPKHTGSPCGYNMAIPSWPMAGEADFKTQFKNKVLSRSRMSYTYNISDPMKFIKHAAYLGKMSGGTLEISSDDIGNKYEMAENIIIDKTLREVTTELTRNGAIEDANPAEIEDAVFKEISKILSEKGVTISDIALVLEPDEQTRLAIDVATAMRVYESAGIADAGKAIAVARAGASKISVESIRNDDKKE